MTLNLDEEVVKIRDVLGRFADLLPHKSEADAVTLADDISAIGPQPVPETDEPTDDELAAELARRNATPTKPLSEMTDEELAAEVAKRQAEAGSQ